MMPRISLQPDPRFFQVLFQLVFLLYGVFWLDWKAYWLHDACSVCSCLLFNYMACCLLQKRLLPLSGPAGWNFWGFSVLISALSLCLLLRTNHWYTSLLAALLTVSSKYIFRFRGKHLFNPSALGIVITIWLSGDAWLSPGQWGSNAFLFFLVVTLGTIVVTRVQKLDSSLGFMLPFALLLCGRYVWLLGWPMDYFLHAISNGGLLLFTFFMISDPRTSPNHPLARIIWAALISIVSFYLAAFRWVNSAPIYVLVAMAPLVPLLDSLFRGRVFTWQPVSLRIHIISSSK